MLHRNLTDRDLERTLSEPRSSHADACMDASSNASAPRAARYRSVFRPGLFEGRTVIVTGGGSGIGRCTAHELVSLGASVALIGRKPEKLERVAAEIAEVGGRASCHPLDIRDEAGVQAGVEAVLAAHGRIDGLVNNAGGQFMTPLERLYEVSISRYELLERTWRADIASEYRDTHRSLWRLAAALAEGAWRAAGGAKSAVRAGCRVVVGESGAGRA